MKIRNLIISDAINWGFPGGSVVKESVCKAGDAGDSIRSMGWEDLLGASMATHSSILAWDIPRTEKPGGLQSIGLQRVGHGWADWACTQGFNSLKDTRKYIKILIQDNILKQYPKCMRNK